jgi:ABC-type cobalamin/Fe3+-siderophores transport system ATPase subunit
MRLDCLRISGFKNLNGVEIDFAEGELSTVLIGLNGTGKSNVLEALVIIFRSLDLKEPIPFRCYLRYECRKRWIEIDNRWSNGNESLQILVDGRTVSPSQVVREANEYLPNHVFGYYSGGSRRFELLFAKHQARYYSAVIRPGAEHEVDPREPTLRRLFYARPFYGQFVLLSYFAFNDQEARDFLMRHMQITGFHSALLVLERPSWARKKPNDVFRQHGDNRFWYATGVVRHLLTALWEHAIAPLRLAEPVQDDYRDKAREKEHVYIFIQDQRTLQALAEPFASQQALFSLLETLDISGLVREVRLWVTKDGVMDELPFHEISDGEKQLLSVLGLMKFTGHAESLFLLDEPDTHLNPAWKRDYLGLIEEVASRNSNSYLAMTTHDPLTISGLTANQVQVLWRDETGEIRATRPVVDPRGLGVAGILTDVFGLESSLDQKTQAALDERNELFAIADEARTPAQEDRLRELTGELATLGFRQAAREPMYARFLQRMQKRRSAEQPAFTPEDIQDLNAVADEIIAELTAGRTDDIH